MQEEQQRKKGRIARMYGRLRLFATSIRKSATETEPGYLERAQNDVRQNENITVRIAALSARESREVFGAPLARVGVQPVWLEIDNQSESDYYLLPAFLDADYFTAKEVAILFSLFSFWHRKRSLKEKLKEREMQYSYRPIRAKQKIRGFVYTNNTPGIKIADVALNSRFGMVLFSFTLNIPEKRWDFQNSALNPACIIDPELRKQGDESEDSCVQIKSEDLQGELKDYPFFTTNKKGTREGDPLNLVIIGEKHDVLATLYRAGWDFTDAFRLASIWQTFKSFILSLQYMNSPISRLYYKGKPHDFALQRVRKTISQRNHLRLWKTNLHVDDEHLWMGQVSRDIGVKFTRHSWFLLTHKIHPEIPEARGYLLQSLFRTKRILKWGFVRSIDPVTEEHAKRNLGNDLFYSDGRRLVIFVSPDEEFIESPERIEWSGEKRFYKADPK